MAKINKDLEARLNFLINTVGIQINPARIAGWHAELEKGGGRDLKTIWSDILRVIGGNQRDKIEKWVADRFAEGGETPSRDRLARIADELISGKFTFDQKKNQIYDAMGYTPAGGGGNPANPALKDEKPKGESQDKQGVGRPGTDDEPGLQILTSKKMSWYFDNKTGKWYVGYGLPGGGRQLVFEASPEDMDSLFGKGKRPANYETITAKNLFARQGVTFGGDIQEMEGTGSFEAEYEAVLARALDEGRLPEWAKNDANAQSILFIAQAEGKSDEWVVDQLSKTKGFQQRFPGLEKIRKEGNLTMTEAVGAFLEYEAGLKALQKQYGAKADAITPSHVSALMSRGYALTQIEDTYEVFDRMKANKQALNAFNEVLKAKGKKPLTAAQQYEFLKGNAPKDVYDVYEASSLREMATQAGIGQYYSAKAALQTAAYTDGSMSNQAIAQSMQQAASMILRMRSQLDLQKYGLTHDELIDLSLGQPVTSGRSEQEIREVLDRITQEARGFLDKQASPFVSFTEDGTPQSASLGGLRQQS